MNCRHRGAWGSCVVIAALSGVVGQSFAVEITYPASASKEQVRSIDAYVSCWWNKAVAEATKGKSAGLARSEADLACIHERFANLGANAEDIDRELLAKLEAYVAAKRPASPKRPYNPNVLKNKDPMFGCSSLRAVDKFINLSNAGRLDLTKGLDCVIIPAGTQVTLMDTVSDYYKQIVWEVDGQPLPLWVIGAFFLDERDRAVMDECRSQPSDCRDRVWDEFYETR